MTRSAWFIVFLVLVAGALAAAVVWRAEGELPMVRGPERIVQGREPRRVVFEVTDARSGLRSLRASLAHAGGEALLVERSFPGSLLRGGGPPSERVELEIDAKALGIGEGSATLRLEARDWSWRGMLAGNAAVRAVPLEIDLKPPRLAVESGLTYVRRGGAGAVVYRISEATARDGVEVGERFYPGVAWGGADRRVALFAIAIDAPEPAEPRVVAEDAAGNLARAAWPVQVQPREIPHEPIALSDAFLQNKIVALAQAWQIEAGDPLAAFRDINTRIRARDEARIRELVARTTPEPLWQGAFEQLENSEVTSVFPERRAYRYGGEVVSEATHYGFDLASLAGAPITASNAGRVIFAGDLGIYGNTVLLDHGLGVSSLYGHLASIEVAEGDAVAKGQTLGRSGQTGLAGGDHLHFAVLVGATYVDPREWWDPKWVREHVDAALGR